MSAFDDPREESAGGFSRRELFLRVGGGLAGVTLASLGLDAGPNPAAAASTISVRDLLRHISPKGCDPSHGIRAALPNDRPVISIRSVASRYAGIPVNYCEPVRISARPVTDASGTYALVTGANFTPGGMVSLLVLFEKADLDFTTPTQALPDGTFNLKVALYCPTSPAGVSFQVHDVASGRATLLDPGLTYSCAAPAPPPPPPKRPNITVSQSGSMFTVKGTGFLPNHTVYVRAVDATTLIQYSAGQTTSDGSGAINYTVSAPCNKGFTIDWSANDGRSVPPSVDITELLWSNTFVTVCQ